MDGQGCHWEEPPSLFTRPILITKDLADVSSDRPNSNMKPVIGLMCG